MFLCRSPKTALKNIQNSPLYSILSRHSREFSKMKFLRKTCLTFENLKNRIFTQIWSVMHWKSSLKFPEYESEVGKMPYRIKKKFRSVFLNLNFIEILFSELWTGFLNRVTYSDFPNAHIQGGPKVLTHWFKTV